MLGMLIPRKSHSRVKSRNSRVSIETLDFARVRTFCQHDRSWIASGGRKVGGAIASQSPALFSIVAGTQVVRPKHRKTAGGGGYKGSATGEAQWPIGLWTMGRGIASCARQMPLGCHWTIGRRRGRIGTQNCRQRPGLVRKKSWDGWDTLDIQLCAMFSGVLLNCVLSVFSVLLICCSLCSILFSVACWLWRIYGGLYFYANVALDEATRSNNRGPAASNNFAVEMCSQPDWATCSKYDPSDYSVYSTMTTCLPTYLFPYEQPSFRQPWV